MSIPKRIPFENVKTVEELSALCHTTQDVIFLTKGNDVDMVAMSMENYQSMVTDAPSDDAVREPHKS